jgi:predicted HTH domain antitoxin
MATLRMAIPAGDLDAPEAVSRPDCQVRIAPAIQWHQRRVISRERVAEAVGMWRAGFLAELARRRVDVFAFDPRASPESPPL